MVTSAPSPSGPLFKTLRVTRDDPMSQHWRDLGQWRGQTLPERLETMAKRLPDHVAVVDDQVRLTFRELDETARRVASSLRRLGLGPGESVLIKLPCWWESVVLMFAVMRVGAVAAQVIPRAGDRHVQAALHQLEPRLFITDATRDELDAAVLTRLRPDSVVVSVRRDADGPAVTFGGLLVGDNEATPQVLDADAPAIVLFTSGTTSVPKGVIHTHNTLIVEGESLAVEHQCTSDDVILVSMQIGHVGGVIYALLLPIVAGATAVLLPEWRPTRAAQLIVAEGVTILPGVPAFASGLRDVEGFDPRQTSIRLFALGGTRVTAAAAQAASSDFGCWTKRGYGSTEMPTATNSTAADGHRIWWETDGKPVGVNRVRVRSSSGALAGAGVEGEVELCGPETFQGYVDASRNEAAFAPDGWYRTGDIGSLDAEGALTITGRTGDVIIRGGENISAQEIEELALDLPEVQDIAVVAMPDERLGERICAYVIASSPITLETLVDHLRGAGLASFKLPERLELRDDFPRTPVGKILKRELRADITQLVLFPSGPTPTDGGPS